ncbi:hypothetical protein HC928_17060 [bacterium]|nr:hypothetical protein [bacterium]
MNRQLIEGVATEVSHNPISVGIKRRQQFYMLILVLTTLSALYQVFYQRAHLLGTVGALVIGVVVGNYFFSRMTQLSWDEDSGRIVPSMDIASVVILLLYVGFVVIGDAPIITWPIEAGTKAAAAASFIAGIMIGQLHSLRRRIRDILLRRRIRDIL